MAIGAYNSDKAEMYTESAGWTQVQNVPHKIVYVQNSVAVVDNVLYIVGGHDYSTWRKGNQIKIDVTLLGAIHILRQHFLGSLDTLGGVVSNGQHLP